MKTFTILFFINFLIVNMFSQTPGGLNSATVGLAYWSKANSTQPGKVNVTAGKVTSWVDENSTYSASQAVVAKQPAFVNTLNPIGVFNYNPYIDFDSSSLTTLLNSATIAGLNSNNMTALVVCNSNGNNGSSLTYANGTNKIQFKCHWRVQNGIAGTGYVSNIIVSPSSGFMSPFFGDSVARIITSHGMGSAFNARVNGLIFPMNLTASLYNPSIPTGMCMGASGTNQYVDDDFAEVLFYNTKLSLADLNKVETYLSLKYGTTFITKQNYTLSNNYVLWDTVIDAPYYYNLTAVGREDASGLYQKQSKSVNYKAMIEMYNDNVSTFPAMNDLNTSTLPNDAYMMIGDNDSSNTLTTCMDNNYLVRIGKIWKIHKTTAFTGQTTLKVESSLLPSTVKNLIVSTNPNFTSGTNTYIPLSTLGTALYASYAFQDNTYFTFGTDTIDVNLNVTAATCSGSKGVAVVTAINGGSPYTYSWSNSLNTSNTSAGLAAGNYTVSVGHGINNSCIITKPFIIKDSSVMKFISTIQKPTCFGGTGSVLLTMTMGTPAYTFTNMNDASTNSTGLFTNLPANTYVFNIKDAAGCDVDTTITITSPTEIFYDTLITPTCWNKESGILSLSAIGGTPPYTFSFNFGTANTITQYNNLASGLYNVKVIDANNCTKAFTITIPTYQAFTIAETNIPATCADPQSASIELTVNNGNAPYSYSWNGFSNTSNILNNIVASNYIVTVSDANNCSEIHTYTATSNCCKVWFPNAFSCNGDGKNELFMPQYSYGLNTVELKIFDRWGNLLYHTKDKTKGWDGTFHGRYCEVGTYYYLMKGSCDNGKVEYKGDITLLK